MPRYEQYWMERGGKPADEIKIEKGIPIPPKRRSPVANRYPWRNMEIGDSFYADVDVLQVQSNAYQTGKALGRRFFVKQQGSGVRVWRIE